MSDEQQEDTSNQEIIAAYKRRENDFNVIKQRIDTTILLADFQTFLTGSKTIMLQDEKGNVKNQKV